MATTRLTTPAGSVNLSTAAVIVLRVAGAALLATNAWIHGHLWQLGYRTIHVIGPLFLLAAVAGSVLALAVLAAPRRWLALAAAAAALFEAGTAGALYLSTQHSLFGFVESSRATLYWPSAITEVIGAVVLAVLAAMSSRRSVRRNSWW